MAVRITGTNFVAVASLLVVFGCCVSGNGALAGTIDSDKRQLHPAASNGDIGVEDASLSSADVAVVANATNNGAAQEAEMASNSAESYEYGSVETAGGASDAAGEASSMYDLGSNEGKTVKLRGGLD